MRLIPGLTWLFVPCLVLVLGAGLGAGPVGADEGAELDEARARQLEVMEEALSVLQLRIQARLEAADTLRDLGRLDEALEAYREIDAVYVQGMAAVRALLAPVAAKAVDAPFRGPAAAGQRAQPLPSQAGRSAPLVPDPHRLILPGAAKPEILDAPGDVRHAVGRALDWLAAHQSPGGGWEAAGFGRWCRGEPANGGPDGAGKPAYDVGVTGLALSAFLGAGYTNRGAHPYAKVVGRGLKYLKGLQDAEGCFGPRTSQHYIYNHAAAAQAMVEAYARTRSPIFKGSAQRALDFIALARNPYFGWRYGVKPGDNDTSVTGWMITVLARARAANEEALSHGLPAPLRVDEDAFRGAGVWIEKMTDPDFGRTGYLQRGGQPARPMAMIDRFPGDKSEAMTAVGLVTRLLIGEDPRRSDALKKGADLLKATPPVWDLDRGSIDFIYWYYGARAALGIGGALYDRWEPALRKALVSSQRRDTDLCGYEGSWDPLGPWGPDGGRVYATALGALTLETLARGMR